MNIGRHRLWNLAVLAIVAVILAISGTLLYLCYRQAVILAYPPRIAAPTALSLNTDSPWRDVSFTTSDGLRLDGWYLPPSGPDSDTPGPAVIFVHGHGANRQQHQREANLLAGEGYGVLLFDLRNHGSSEGSVTSMGYFETEDVRAAFDFMSAQPEVDPLRIGLYGHSMGAATVIRAMARIPQARILIVSAPYTDFLGLTQDGIRIRTGLPAFPFAQLIVWMTGQASGADLFDLRPIDDMAQITPRPVLILHGDADFIVPVEHGRRLYDAAQGAKVFYAAPGVGHPGLFAADPDEFSRQVLPFLAEHLRDD
jgi:uncharacterized protein